jgi:NADH:ubiquinone oxidoreductase subunit E
MEKVCTVSKEVKDYEEKYKHLLEGNSGNDHIIPILKEIQSTEGYIPQHAIIAISNCLNVPLAQVYGIVTFYNFFKLEKQGTNVISVCEGTACHIKGAPTLLDVIKKKIGIGPGEISQDGKFSVEIVRCLGLCAFAPVMMINEKSYTKLDEKMTEEALEEYLK